MLNFYQAHYIYKASLGVKIKKKKEKWIRPQGYSDWTCSRIGQKNKRTVRTTGNYFKKDTYTALYKPSGGWELAQETRECSTEGNSSLSPQGSGNVSSNFSEEKKIINYMYSMIEMSEAMKSPA